MRRFGLAFGHAMAFCDSPTAAPWRMVPTSSGWSSHGPAPIFAAAELVLYGAYRKERTVWDAGLRNTAESWGAWLCWR